MQPPKGTRDLFEADLAKIEFVQSRLFSVARSYGFSRVDTPVFEHLDIFDLTAAVNREKCYIFPDQAGRELILRPDINAPLSRLVVNNFSSAPLPIRLFFAGKVFRYRRSVRREFRMFGLETYGLAAPSADAEILRATADIIADLGFPGYEVEYSNLRIYHRFLAETAAVRKLSLNPTDLLHQLRVARERAAILAVLGSCGLPGDAVDTVVSLLLDAAGDAESHDALSQAARRSAALQEELMQAIAFRRALADYGLHSVRFNSRNLHGAGFYSGLTYRVTPTGCSRELADGGRYDSFVERLGGRPMPATGLGLGLERLITLAEEQGLTIDAARTDRRMMVVCCSREVAVRLRPLLSTLRQSGRVVEEELCERKRRKTILYAQGRGYCQVVFISSTGLTPAKFKLEIVPLAQRSERETIVTESAEQLLNVLNLLR